MNSKANILLWAGTLLSLLGGCTNSKEEVDGDDSNTLRVQVKMVEERAWNTTDTRAVLTTDSLGNRQVVIPCDTVKMGDEEYVIEAIEEQMAAQPQISTRGTPMTSGSEIKNLTVKLFEKTNTWDETSMTPTKVIKMTNSSGSYIGDNTYAWNSTTNYVTLYAYSPIAAPANGMVDDTYNTLTYTVPADIANQPDICLAEKKLNKQNTSGSNSHLQLFTMHHVLTAVGFAMRGYDVKITKITVKGVYATGSLVLKSFPENYSETAASGSLPSGLWIGQATTKDFSPVINTSTNFKDQYNAGYQSITQSSGYLMMIPQTIPVNAILEIEYTGLNEQSSGTIKTSLSKWIAVWKAGRKVTYNIRLKTAPAVVNDQLVIENRNAGYTTTVPLKFNIAGDDNLTFTWDAKYSWLRIHRGSPKAGDTSGGASSGWKTGTGGPWSNIYFFSTTDNSSFTDRTATVTVEGTKSGKRTFTVKQEAKVELNVNSTYLDLDNVSPYSWEPGSCNNITFTSSHPKNVVIQSVSASWLRAAINSNNNSIKIDYDWNVMGAKNRDATIKLGVVINGVTMVTKNVTVHQRASKFWIILNDDKSFRLGVYYETYGEKNKDAASTTCLMRTMVLGSRSDWDFIANWVSRHDDWPSDPLNAKGAFQMYSTSTGSDAIKFKYGAWSFTWYPLKNDFRCISTDNRVIRMNSN